MDAKNSQWLVMDKYADYNNNLPYYSTGYRQIVTLLLKAVPTRNSRRPAEAYFSIFNDVTLARPL